MDKQAIEWLLKDDNPAVQYRTRNEILGVKADKAPVIAWLRNFLPADWTERKGLWSTYYLKSFAECGLVFEDMGIAKETLIGADESISFHCGCEDYIRLRALVRLGLAKEPAVIAAMDKPREGQLPDGGFLCLHRLDKMKYTPKSCVKDNTAALMFCAECRKRGVQTDIEEPLLEYFWKHNLFYRTDNPQTLILNAREGWRTIDTFYPFEVMRIGLQNIVESLCALGHGRDPRVREAWDILQSKRGGDGKYVLDGTLSKSYLPKERINRASKWVTFYVLLAQKECSAHETLHPSNRRSDS